MLISDLVYQLIKDLFISYYNAAKHKANTKGTYEVVTRLLVTHEILPIRCSLITLMRNRLLFFHR